MKRRVLAAFALACGGAALAPSLASAQFTYQPSGQLVSGSGRGRSDQRVYAPGMRFPIQNAPAYLNSQVWGVGGGSGPSGSQCDTRNFSYPWWDNYCETRSWDMPLCPSGQGHQGQDMRASNCMNRTHPVVAVADGQITNIGSYSVYLTGTDGTRYDYLHMGPVSVTQGQRVTRGTAIGRVSNEFGGSATTIHLHFNIRQNVSGVGSVYVPPYMSLIRAYEELLMMSGTSIDGGTRDAGSSSGGSLSARYVNQTFPLSETQWVLPPGSMQTGYLEMRNTGTVTWTPALTELRTSSPRDMASALRCTDWPSNSVAARIDREVPPGSTGRFNFAVCAPSAVGDYPQFFNLVHDGTWFSDSSGTPPDNQIEVRVTVQMGAVVGTDADADGYTVEMGDCDDTNPAVRPNATEICGNGVDEDCDAGDATCTMTMVTDNDQDGSTVEDGDCNDGDPTVRPGATEICGNDRDEDCDGADLPCGPGIDAGRRAEDAGEFEGFDGALVGGDPTGNPRPTRGGDNCGCTVPGGGSPRSHGAWIVGALGLALASRRRRASR